MTLKHLRNIILEKKYENFLVITLRWSLSIIFIWFGALKILGYNPVFDLIYNSLMPTLAAGTGLLILGIAEVTIGILLLSNRALLFTHTILLFHLLGTFSTFIFGWHIIFSPYFPILTLDGEFVIKNIILVIGGLLVLIYEMRKKNQ